MILPLLAYFSEKIGCWLVLNKSLHNLCYPQVMNENFKGFNFPTFFTTHARQGTLPLFFPVFYEKKGQE